MFRTKIHPISTLAMIMFLSMIVADLFSSINLPLVGNADEIMGAIAWGGVLFFIFRNMSAIKKSVMYLFIWILLLGVIGIIGNILSGIVKSSTMVGLDMFLFSKPYIIFLFWMLFSKQCAHSLIPSFAWVARLGIWVLTICALISQVANIGMRSSRGAFVFFAGYGGTVSWWVILFLALIWSTSRSDKETVCYLIMSGIVILLNGSGLGTITYGIGVLMFIALEKKKKVKWYYAFLIIIACVYLGRSEISEYLLTNTSPRALFFKYAFVTANTYAPFGAGFATYGSSTAIRNYSELYYKYGFNQIYGMTKEYHPYLMDNYYQQIIGQFGYIGAFALGIYIYVTLKRILSFQNTSIRNGTLLLYGCLIIAGVAFGTASSWGCTVYMLIPLLARWNEYIKTRESLKINEKELASYNIC